MSFGLNENQLKMIAVVSMAIDHIGYFLFPQMTILRRIGRLAFPIFAYFIAEGCYYTRNLWCYCARVGILGLICLIVTFIADGRIYGNILITFALSILIAAMLKLNPLIGVFFCGIVLWITMQMEIDYGFVGILIPVGCRIARIAAERNPAEEEAGGRTAEASSALPGPEETAAEKRRIRNGRMAQLSVMAAGLVILSFQLEPYQWMGLFALPLLLLYNGKRGSMNLKWFFYLFYPLHIVVIQIIGMLL